MNRDHATQLLLDTRLKNTDLHTRTLIDLPPGEKTISLDVDLTQAHYLCLHPVNAEEEVCITLCHASLTPASPAKKPKVKCVIWDLDHSLWEGILVENPHVELRRHLVQLIRELDARGIVNSIASKNNEEQARAVLRDMGIEDLFVFCKINWQPKSINIRNTISEMNINANTVVFVDDSPFERDEVSSAIEGIICLDPAEIEAYSRTERFQVPLSAESAGRRQTYRQLEKMVSDRQHWKGNIDSFLLSCDIRLEILRPTDAQWDRCYELVQRTNQLNASGRRLSKEEILAMGTDSSHDCLAMQSSDRYGAYGLVGFMIVERREEGAVITDFVISCRVARKKIEQTLVNHLAKVYGGQVFFTFKPTKANHPMKELIEELSMTLVRREGEAELYRHDYKEHYPAIVRLTDGVFAQPAFPPSEQDA
ncbi:MAG: HAD-IIIC family phosphatase [Akkermansia sp.]